MRSPQEWDTEDLVILEDEELVRLIQQHGPAHPATSVLLLRYHGWINKRIARQARRQFCRPDDIDDAKQEGFLILLEAVTSYDPTPEGDRKACRFRSFLWTVVGARFQDFVRHLQRRERRNEPGVDLDELLAGAGHNSALRRVTESCEPSRLAEGDELLDRLQAALGQLRPEERWIWDQSASGISLKAIAERMNLPYHQVKRQRQQIQAQIANYLKDWRES